MKLFLVAGEPSGDRLGAALIDGLRQVVPGVVFRGVGGDAMARSGLTSIFPMERLSIMGIAEIVPRLPKLFRLRDRTAAAAVDWNADALVTIDSPDFGLRLAGKVRSAAPRMPTIHYVAPSVWAWRAGRAARMARVIDHVLALLPFEPPYMEAAGMSCDFVGHPVVAAPRAGVREVAAFKAAYGGRIALILPGSRRGEIARMSPVFGAALRRLPRDVRVVVPTLSHLTEQVTEATRCWPVRPVIVSHEADRMAAFAAADAALAASGTVSLDLAANDVPMVVAYDMAWLSRIVVTQLLRVDTVTLVNLVTGVRAVPEFLGDACRAEPVGDAFADLLNSVEARERQRAVLRDAMARLGAGGPSPGLRAARSVVAKLAG